MPKFKIITLGCKVNQYESAYLGERLSNNGWNRTESDKAVDLIIINTCIVTQKASHQSRQEIRRAIRENPTAKVVVTGCYAQAYPEELLEIKGIDVIMGNKGKEEIPELIKELDLIHRPLLIREFSRKEPFYHMPVSRFSGRSRAFLKIQDGCESFCSYCIVPYARGPYRSMSIKDVQISIEALIRKGYKEIVLTGIHLGKYGIDQGSNLEQLLKEIGRQRYPVRIRLSSIEPNEISEELINMISQEEWICKHLHIPLQSGDDRILRKMNRSYTRKDFYNLIMKIYHRVPFIAIGVDIMAGFPGEDSLAHNMTLSLVKELPVSYLHVFPYSDRPKTTAFYFKEKISSKIIKKRAKEIRELGKVKRREFLKRCQGKVFTAIIESKTENALLKSLTENYIQVLSPAKKPIRNQLIKVRIEDIKGNCVTGSME